MPELPEVEVVKQGLREILGPLCVIEGIEFKRPNLRWPLPKDMPKKILGQKILELQRRAKYILIKTSDYYIVSHLGMTGTWRKEVDSDSKKYLKKHDHIIVKIFDPNSKTHFSLVYNDPRRFGSFDYFAHANLEDYKHFSDLGPEPFSEDFSLEYFYQKSRNKSSPIKNFIMDQRIVVGVGNIYAAEALFISAIKPTREAGKVKRQELEILRKNIIDILHLAIEKGGSSIKDFKQADGSESYFQMDFKVYDRAGQACFECGSILKNIVLGGRASVYCHRCQK